MFTESAISFDGQATDYLFSQSDADMHLIDDKWSAVWQTLLNDADLNYTDTKEPVSIASRITQATSAIYSAICEGWTCSIAFSSGKDSTTVLHLFLMALMRAVRNGTNVSQHHFLFTADTLVENPEIHHLSTQVLSRLQAFIDEHKLPLTILVARPSLTQSWVGRILTGRGLPTYTSSSTRQCSFDLKIIPLRQAKARYLKNLPPSIRDKVCLMLGSRDDESSIRASNIARMGGAATTITMTPQGGELYPIKDWGTQHVWSFLTESGSAPRFPLPSFQSDNFAIAELYKEATGECIWSVSERVKTSACSARFGCFSCTSVGLDKSMTALINNNPDKYGYQTGLNRLQRFLSKIQYDWSKRDYIGRTLFEGGYVRLQPNVFSSMLTERLFHICCSLDYAEAKRAAELEQKLNAGEVEDTPYHRRMCEPQFRIITERNVLHVDFLWSLHCFNSTPFRAIAIYRDVWDKGILDLLDDEPAMEPVARTPMPAARWMRIPGREIGTAFDGLSDPASAMAYFDGNHDPRAARMLSLPSGTVPVVSYEEEDEVTVDEDTASFIIWSEWDGLRQRVADGEFTGSAAAQYLLRYGVIRLAKGKGNIYHRLAQRGQFYQRHGLSDKEPLAHLIASKRFKIIDDKQYRQLVGRKLKGERRKQQFWCCVAAVMALHTHNRTALGEWLLRGLSEEASRERTTDADRIKARLIDGILNVCNLRLKGFVGHNQADADRKYYRVVRKQVLSYVQACLKKCSNDIVQDVVWELRLVLNRKSPGTGYRYIDAVGSQGLPVLQAYLRFFIRLHDSVRDERI